MNFRHATLALLAGIGLAFSFAPYGYWPLGFLSTGLFYWVLTKASVRQGLVYGSLFGFGYFGFGVYWIYFSVHIFGGAIVPLSVLVTFLFVLLMTFFSMACGYIFARLNQRILSHYFAPLLFASIWGGLELLRGWLFGGFPWLLLGYSQIDTLFSGYAPIVGVYGISWVVAFCGALLVTIVTTRQRVPRMTSALILLVLTGAAAILEPVEWSEAKPAVLAIRLVQGNIKQEMKFSQKRLRSSLQTYVEMTRSAPPGTQVVVWPETAIPTFFNRVDNALQPFVQEMDARGIEVLSGGFHRDDQQRSYNGFRQLGGDRELYVKRHLVPFGEFMPMRFVLDHVARFIEIPMSDLSAGRGPVKPLLIHGEKLGISICYEDVFGEEMRASLPESTVLVNVSNDAWFGDSSAPHQHQEMARMRARELSRPLVRVTNTGISSVITHRGEITASIAQSIKGVLDVKVVPRVGSTPYVTVGNLPVIAICALVAGLAAFGAGGRRPAL